MNSTANLYTAESHFGQSDSLARDTLAGTLWPEWHFGQGDSLDRDTLAGETFWLVTLLLVTHWPE